MVSTNTQILLLTLGNFLCISESLSHSELEIFRVVALVFFLEANIVYVLVASMKSFFQIHIVRKKYVITVKRLAVMANYSEPCWNI